MKKSRNKESWKIKAKRWLEDLGRKNTALAVSVRILSMCVLVLGSLFFSQFIVGLIMLGILGSGIAGNTLWTAVYSVLSYGLASIFIFVIPAKVLKKRDFGTNREELGLIGMPSWTDVGLAPIGYIVAMFLAAGLTKVFSLFSWFNLDEAQEIGFNSFLPSGERMIAFVVLVVIAPIIEEIIFRGWLYGRIRNRLNGRMSEAAGIAIATILVSVAFGIAHLQWNVGVVVFAMSLILCGLREITGTIYSGILLHMIKNAVAFFMIFLWI